MQSVEPKKIVIRLPSLQWSSFFSIHFLIIVLAFLLLGGGVYWYQNIRPFLRIDSAYLNAFSTTVYSDIAGRIAQMGPQEGDLVKKGETLFSIDRNSLLAREGQIKSALASLSQQIEFDKEQMGKAMEAYLAATTEGEFVSSEGIEKYLTLMDEAQNKSETGLSKAEALKKELGLIELEAKKGSFEAPFQGVILKRHKDLGASLSLGEPVYTLCDPEQLWIEAEIPETELSQISIGTPAKIWFAAYPKKELKGQVTYIAPTTVSKRDFLPFSEKKPTIPIKISVVKGDLSLKPGLSAKVALKVR